MHMPYANPNGGFWLDAPGRWIAFGQFFGQNCAADLCGISVGVDYGNARKGLEVRSLAARDGTIIIRGSTISKVRERWRAAFPRATFESVVVDGARGFRASGAPGGRELVLVMRDGRLYIIAAAGFMGINIDREFAAFLRGFHFMPAACWIEPCRDDGWSKKPAPLVSFDAGRTKGGWTSQGATWRGASGPGDRSMEGFAKGPCFQVSKCRGYVSITVGTASTGPVVDATSVDASSSWWRASGATLNEVAASTAGILGASAIRHVKIAGVSARRLSVAGREVAILSHRGRFIVISAFAGWDPFDGLPASNAASTLDDFLAGFELES